MRFTVERGALMAAVKLARIAVPTRPTSLPIIAHFVLTATPDGGLLVEATDMEIVAAAECPAVVDSPGRATVPAMLLASMLAQCPAPRLSGTLEKSKMRLIGQGAKLMLPALDAEDWPDWSGNAVPVSLGECDAAAFREAVGRVEFAANEGSGTVQQGVHLEFLESVLQLTALDGFRFASAVVPVARAGDAERFAAIVPADCLKKIAGALLEGQIQIERRGNLIGFVCAAARARVRTIDGAFPNWRMIIPQELPIAVTLPRTELRDAARLALLAGDAGKGGASGRSIVRVDLTIGPDGCVVRGANDAEAELTVPIMGEATIPPCKISLDGGYLIDALGALPGDSVTLRAQDNLRVQLLLPAGEQADTAVSVQGIMPLNPGTR